MGNYEQLKQSVSDVIKTNGNKEITGSILQNVLLTIISTVGANATFAGIATPATNPGTPDGPVFYLASESGTYSNFGSIELQDGLSVLMWNGSWSSQQIFGVDDEPTAGSDNLVKSGGVYDEFSHLTGITISYLGIEDEQKSFSIQCGDVVSYKIKNMSDGDGYFYIEFRNGESKQKRIDFYVHANSEETGTYIAEANIDALHFINTNQRNIIATLENNSYKNFSLGERQRMSSAFENGYALENQDLNNDAKISVNLVAGKIYTAHISNNDSRGGYYRFDVKNVSGSSIYTSATFLLNAGESKDISFILSQQGVSVNFYNLNKIKTKFSIKILDEVGDILLTKNRPYTFDSLEIIATNCTTNKNGNSVQISKSAGNNITFTMANKETIVNGDFLFIRMKVMSTVSEWVKLILYGDGADQRGDWFYLEAGVTREIAFRGNNFTMSGTIHARIEQNTSYNLADSVITVSDLEVYKNGYSNTKLPYLDYSEKNKKFVVDINGGGHFYSIANAVNYIRSSFDVAHVPYTIFVRNGVYDKEKDTIVQQGYPYAVINKGSNLISIIGESKENTIIRWTNTPDVEYKVIEVGSSACVIANLKIECLKGTGYDSQTIQRHNPYCLHIDLGGDIDMWGKYQTEIYNCHLYDECHSPIGAGLTKNQTINVHDCYLEADVKTGTTWDTLYIHANAGGQSTVDNTMAVDIENNILINKSGGKALTLPDVGHSTFRTILCTIIGNLLYSNNASNIVDADAGTRYNKAPYCMGNNIPDLNSFEYTV